MDRKITKEEAIALHRQMWSDMKDAIGNRPGSYARMEFKRRWCEINGYEGVCADCFLCEYVEQNVDLSRAKGGCQSVCPIDWGKGCMRGDVRYSSSPISEILALPERGM